LNLVLLGGVIFVLMNPRKEETISTPVLPGDKLLAQPVATAPSPATPGMESKPFHWNQLESTKDYRLYVANLRAIGCPEPTIEDIVRGDADRAFSWERRQLGLDGSGSGPWSRSQEGQLIASLLGKQSAETTALARNTENQVAGRSGVESAGTSATERRTANLTQENAGDEVAQVSLPSQGVSASVPAYPLFLQNANWSALGFNAGQQAAIAQVRQQFLSDVSSLNQSSGDAADQNPDSMNQAAAPANSDSGNPDSLAQWQKAFQSADNQLRDLLGGQGYMAYEQAQYNAWFEAQQDAANAQGVPLAINPTAFSLE